MEYDVIYHICRREDWLAAQPLGRYAGSAGDRRDGFIHFSTAEQVRASAAKHHAGRDGLVLLSVDTAGLGAALKWEASRGGALFPHLHAPLPLAAVLRVDDLPVVDGRHRFPALA